MSKSGGLIVSDYASGIIYHFVQSGDSWVVQGKLHTGEKNSIMGVAQPLDDCGTIRRPWPCSASAMVEPSYKPLSP